MRIAIFPSAYFPSLGGVEELVRQLSLSFEAQGHEVLIVTNRWPRDLPASEVLDGISVHRFALRVPAQSLRSILSFALTSRRVRKQVRRLLRDQGIDLIHVQCISSNGEYAMDAAQALHIPLVVTTQGEITMDAQRIYQESKRVNRQLKRIVQSADAVTAVSAKTLEDLERQLGARLPNASVIYNGASLAEMAADGQYQHPRPYVLALGRLVAEKGFDDLISAVALSAIPQDVLIAGTGPKQQELEAQAEALGLAPRVFFLGAADRSTVAALHAGAEWFVLPSRTDEGLPLAAVEALAAGSAMIATRTGGLPEIVQDGVHALLVDKGDVDGLAAAMQTLNASPSLRETLGRNAVDAASALDWKRLGRQYLEVMSQAVMATSGLAEAHDPEAST